MTPTPWRWSRIAAAAAYVLFLLVLLETASRALLASGWVLQHLGRQDPTIQRLKWVHGHGKMHFQYTFDVYDSLRGWSIAPDIVHASVFDRKVLNSTPRGVRGAMETPYARTPGKRRILVFGDSYTFGEEVSDDETYAANLARILSSTEVVNLGVEGYGHDQMLEYLRAEGVKYRPDVIVLGYVWFDQYRNLFTFTSYAKPKFELRADRLYPTGVPVPRPAAVLASERWRSRALELLNIVIEASRWRLGFNEARAQVLTRAILDAVVGTARSIGAFPVLVYLPVLDELKDTSSVPDAHEQYLRAFCSSRQIRCLFLQSTFARAYRQGARFPTTRHWNAATHLLAAKALAAYLVGQGLADTVESLRPPARR